MKKQTLILALTLVITLSASILAGDTHSNGGDTHSNGGGIAEIICQICDALTGATHP